MFIVQIPKLFNWVKNIVLLAVGLGSIPFFYVVNADNWERYQSRHWPTAIAQIDSAKIEIDDETNQGSMLVAYSYLVNDQLYIREITEKSSKKSPLSIEQKQEWRSYLSGQDITVYYKPNAPNKSFIAKERILLLKDFIWFMVGTAFIMLLGGAVCLFVAIDGFKTK